MKPSRADRILADWDQISRQASRPSVPQRNVVTSSLPISMVSGATIFVVVVLAIGLGLGVRVDFRQPGGPASPPAVVITPPPVATTPSPPPTSPPPVATTPSPVATSPSSAGPWGPLAVLPPQDGTDLAALEGTLRIADGCVYLDSNGNRYDLAWHANQVTWSEETRSISFKNFEWNYEGAIVTLRDGDHVALGGGGLTVDDAEGVDWVADPGICTTEGWFTVGIVEPF